MEEWYSDLIARPSDASSCFARDYEPYSFYLSNLRGSILDVGGGVGLVRDYLVGKVQYVVIDPSSTWLDQSWSTIATCFPSIKERGLFVKGIGELLPFASGSFDNVLAFWSLNHSIDPAQCISEIYDVLRPGGRALLVLEDMEPSWPDVLLLCAHKIMKRLGIPLDREFYFNGGPGGAKRTILHKLLGREWPLQVDHKRIEEDLLRQWFEFRFRVINRDWTSGFLTYQLERVAKAGAS
jgi:SAM-dependent methyltransferase